MQIYRDFFEAPASIFARMNYYFVDKSYQSGDTALLDEQECHHAFHVMRMNTGETIHLLDGKGYGYSGKIILINKKKCEVHIETLLYEASPSIKIEIAVAPPKSSERLDWMIEKLIETGADDIYILESKRTERSRINIDRMKKVSVSALKQCKRKWMPQIHLCTFDDYIKKTDAPNKLILSIETTSSINLIQAFEKPESTSILIGPEGDFTQEETQHAIQSGFKAVSLGNSILRTETAAIYSCAVADAFRHSN